VERWCRWALLNLYLMWIRVFDKGTYNDCLHAIYITGFFHITPRALPKTAASSLRERTTGACAPTQKKDGSSSVVRRRSSTRDRGGIHRGQACAREGAPEIFLFALFSSSHIAESRPPNSSPTLHVQRCGVKRERRRRRNICCKHLRRGWGRSLRCKNGRGQQGPRWWRRRPHLQ
jgi:hypothetical protein